MKLVNFASFDPAHRKRNVRGLSNASSLDREIWEEFEAGPNAIAQQSEEAFNQLSLTIAPALDQEPQLPQGPTEKELTRPMRLVQTFFRRSVLASYGYKCSFCRLDVHGVLNASHIIPWNVSKELRADPRNGICLCALHDRAFDRGLMTVDPQNRVAISKSLQRDNPTRLHRVAFLELQGHRICLPGRFFPEKRSLEYHRNIVFKQAYRLE